MHETGVQQGSGTSHEPPPRVTRTATHPRIGGRRPKNRSHEHVSPSLPSTTLERWTSERLSSTSCTEDQTDGDAKTIAKTVTDHKDSDSEWQEQVPNTVDSIAVVQKSITEPDDKRCDADGQQCETDGATCGGSWKSATARKESESEDRQKVNAGVYGSTVYPGGGS